MTQRLDAWAVILAGGIGSRFWPASRPDRPKQLLALGSERPLFLETWERAVHLVGPERVLVVAPAALLAAFRDLVTELPEEVCLAEPSPRGTAPALAWAAWHIRSSEPDGVMISMHADHIIEPIEAFRDTLARAISAAREDGRLYCIGIRPDRPETGYGYIRLGRPRAPAVFEVDRFVEKPDRETAEAYVASGEYLWNTGIFVWRAVDLLTAIQRLTPEVGPALGRLERGDVAAFFAAVEPVSVDVGVLERSDGVGTVEASFQWDDVGVWNALARTRSADGAGNILVGPVQPVDSRENIVWAEDGPVTLFGVEGLVVVRSGGQTLVTTRERASELKDLVSRIEIEANGEIGNEPAAPPKDRTARR